MSIREDILFGYSSEIYKKPEKNHCFSFDVSSCIYRGKSAKFAFLSHDFPIFRHVDVCISYLHFASFHNVSCICFRLLFYVLPTCVSCFTLYLSTYVCSYVCISIIVDIYEPLQPGFIKKKKVPINCIVYYDVILYSFQPFFLIVCCCCSSCRRKCKSFLFFLFECQKRRKLKNLSYLLLPIVCSFKEEKNNKKKKFVQNFEKKSYLCILSFLLIFCLLSLLFLHKNTYIFIFMYEHVCVLTLNNLKAVLYDRPFDNSLFARVCLCTENVEPSAHICGIFRETHKRVVFVLYW